LIDDDSDDEDDDDKDDADDVDDGDERGCEMYKDIVQVVCVGARSERTMRR
jgi:hypothetical protein